MSDPEQALQKTTGDGIPSRPSIEGIEDALLDGDLSKLNPQQRVSYMERVCQSVGLNPLTKPFRYIRLNGQLTLYATRDAAEQLRKVHGISITSLEETWRENLCIFRAHAKDAEGRTDVATGAVDTSRSSGQALANDIMKAETKAKRRVTLSLAGLGWLDETEVQDIPEQATEEVSVDYETGELKEQKPDAWYEEATEWIVSKVRDGGAEASDVLANTDSFPSGHPINDWPEDIAERAIDRVKQAQTDRTSQKAKEATAETGDPTPYDGPQDALEANFDTAWAEGNEGLGPISEAQLERMYAIADENDWKEAALNRLVKDELGYESKKDVPYGDPYDEICAALEDERLRYHMSRDPDTPDMFEESADDGEANHPEFEDANGDLPF
jgi:dsDNA-binding SOS-regulon protein